MIPRDSGNMSHSRNLLSRRRQGSACIPSTGPDARPNPAMKKVRVSFLAWLSVGIVLLGACLTILAGGEIAAPTQAEVGLPPRDLAAESVEIPSPSGSVLKGWF